MSDRPYVLLSCAASIDGYIDDASGARLLLSNDADFDRVDAVRASCDAILVGAETIRRDDPRLLVRSERRRAERLAAGRTASPIRVTVTGSGRLDPAARFFASGGADTLVYAASGAIDVARGNLGPVTTVIDAGEPLELARLLADLAGRGVERLMVEGGGTVHSWFLAEGLADELQLVIAPFFVGDEKAPRFVEPGRYANDPGNPLHLDGVERIGDVVLLRYLADRGA